MTTLAPHGAPTIHPTPRQQAATPLPVRSLPSELLDIDLDVLPTTDESTFGPSPELLLTCSAIVAGIMSAALLAGELLVRLI